MADVIRALTEAWEKVGGQAVMTIVMIVAAGYVVFWNRRLVAELSESRKTLAEIQGKALLANTVSMNDNTVSNLKASIGIDKLTEEYREQREALKKIGSDTKRICNYPAPITESGS